VSAPQDESIVKPGASSTRFAITTAVVTLAVTVACAVTSAADSALGFGRQGTTRSGGH
jgi:hypothetical protein